MPMFHVKQFAAGDTLSLASPLLPLTFRAQAPIHQPSVP